MLKNSSLIAFIPTRDLKKTREFYERTLGLRFVSEDPFALVFDANGTMLRIANLSNVVDFKPFPFTILGWQVASAQDTVRELAKKGIKFERFPGMDQNELGDLELAGRRENRLVQRSGRQHALDHRILNLSAGRRIAIRIASSIVTSAMRPYPLEDVNPPISAADSNSSQTPTPPPSLPQQSANHPVHTAATPQESRSQADRSASENAP